MGDACYGVTLIAKHVLLTLRLLDCFHGIFSDEALNIAGRFEA